MTITALPTAPDRATPTTFPTLADSWVAALATFTTEANALAAAMNLNSTTATSVTSLLIEVASKALTVDINKSYQPGMSVKIARTASPSNWMHGDVTTYNANTGALVVNVTSILGSGTYTDWTITLSAPIITPDTVVLPTNHLSGLGLSHAVDTDHDITIAVGKARDDTDVADMVLASALTKQADAEWAVGTAAGGFATGESLPASGTIHVWLIKRDDTDVVDVMFNDHATTGLSPTLPPDYDYKRRIGSYRTDASNNILNGNRYGTGVDRKFMLDANIVDYNGNPAGTNAISYALSVPNGIQVETIFDAEVVSASTYYALFSSLDNTDEIPSATNYNHYGLAGFIQKHEIMTNTAGEIRFRSISEPTLLKIMTRGWIDFL